MLNDECLQWKTKVIWYNTSMRQPLHWFSATNHCDMSLQWFTMMLRSSANMQGDNLQFPAKMQCHKPILPTTATAHCNNPLQWCTWINPYNNPLWQFTMMTFNEYLHCNDILWWSSVMMHFNEPLRQNSMMMHCKKVLLIASLCVHVNSTWFQQWIKGCLNQISCLFIFCICSPYIVEIKIGIRDQLKLENV
jgi:hypothetical protein